MMTNSKMESIGIVTMMMIIMLGCTGAKDITLDKSCGAKCFFDCLLSQDPFPPCYSRCKAKCEHRPPPNDYDQCINSCSVTKSNIGIHFLTRLISILIFYMYYLFIKFIIFLHLFNNLLLCIR